MNDLLKKLVDRMMADTAASTQKQQEKRQMLLNAGWSDGMIKQLGYAADFSRWSNDLVVLLSSLAIECDNVQAARLLVQVVEFGTWCAEGVIAADKIAGFGERVAIDRTVHDRAKALLADLERKHQLADSLRRATSGTTH